MNEQINEQDPQVAEGLRKLKEKLGLVPAPIVESDEEAAAMAGEVETVVAETPVQTGIDGKDVDWSNFDLDPNVAHMYPAAKYVQTLEGPKWVSILDVFEFISGELMCPKGQEKSWAKQGKKTLGDTLTEKVNGGDRWRIATVFASGPGFGAVMMTRTVQIVLPDPRELVTDAVLPPQATEPELQQVEDAALAWIEQEGQAVEAETPIIGNPDHDYTPEEAAAKAAGVPAPEKSPLLMDAEPMRVPLGAGFNATDGEGSILPTTFAVPAVLAVEAAEQAAAVMFPQVELPLDEAGA